MDFNIVFEGGGIKGLAYVGALRYLEIRGVKINNLAGSSVGALFAALIAVGYTAKELQEIINFFDINILLHKSKKIGFHSLSRFEQYLDYLFMQKGKMTFGQMKVGNNYKLRVTTTSLKLRKNIIIPDDLEQFGIEKDSFKISKAICMSCAIPLFYDPIKVGNDSFYDGGLSDNFPYYVLDNPILGFRIGKDKKIINFFQRTIFKRQQVSNAPFIITIDTSSFHATDFKNGLKKRHILYNRGFYFTKAFFMSQKKDKR